MSINPGGTNYNWNYSKPDKPGYSPQLIGTVLAIQEVQKMGYTMNGQPGAPEFWPDGNPKMNIRLALATESGEIKTFTFQPAGKAARAGEKKSVHMDLFALTGNTDMMNLIGKTICIQTQEGYYGQGHPRPWFVSLVEAGPYQPSMPLPSEFKVPQVLANAAASGGQVNAPQQQPAYRPQPAPQPQYQQPAYQPQPAPQPQYQQPAYQPQPAPAQPAAQQYPSGMDPNIAQAMQTLGVTNVEMVPREQQQPVNPVGNGEVYGDDDLPF
jgi:hypothetical protein